MTIAKALKRKNKLTGEINQLKQLIQQENRIKEGKTRNIDIEKTSEELNLKIQELIDIKSAISRANNSVVDKIYTLSEYKSQINFLKTLPTDQGEEKETIGYSSVEKVNYTVVITKNQTIESIKKLQEKIDKLQEELDQFNFTTHITYPEGEDLPF